jgi:quercetin dioxygenase-like cupin family protein
MPRTSSDPTPARRFAAGATAVTDGAALTFETVPVYEHGVPPLRIHPDRTTLLRVVDGVVRLTTGNVVRLLGAGDEAIVKAAQPHRIAGVAREGRVVMGFRGRPL